MMRPSWVRPMIIVRRPQYPALGDPMISVPSGKRLRRAHAVVAQKFLTDAQDGAFKQRLFLGELEEYAI